MKKRSNNPSFSFPRAPRAPRGAFDRSLRAQIRRPVNVDNAAGQKIRPLRRQEQNGLGDFVRPSHALEWALTADGLSVRAVDFPGDALRVDEARRDGVNEDVEIGRASCRERL